MPIKPNLRAFSPCAFLSRTLLLLLAGVAIGCNTRFTFAQAASPAKPAARSSATLKAKVSGKIAVNGITNPVAKMAAKETAKETAKDVVERFDPEHLPVYTVPPVITALAYSPDGIALAVSGYHEIVLHHADGTGITARLIGQSEKILSLVYTLDGKMLAAVGGSPARFGEIQFWDTATNRLVSALQPSTDTLFGGSFSPDGKELAFGATDNAARVVTVPDGKLVMKLDSHGDWVFATAFTMDGRHILSTGRDQAVKLTLVEGGSFIDDINTHTSAYRCLARNPKADQVICAGDDGIPRLYKVFRTEARTMNQEDHNLLHEYERQTGVATAIAFSPDAMLFAVGAESGLVQVYTVAEGRKVATLRGHRGVVYAVAFAPDGKNLAAGGFDGKVRLYAIPSGKLIREFVPVPLQTKAAKSGIQNGSAACCDPPK